MGHGAFVFHRLSRLAEGAIQDGLAGPHRGAGIVGRHPLDQPSDGLRRSLAGEVFNLVGVVSKQKTEVELIDGGRCIFAKETDHLPRLTAKAPLEDGVVDLRIDRPGYYSIRLKAEGAPRDMYAALIASKPAQ